MRKTTFKDTIIAAAASAIIALVLGVVAWWLLKGLFLLASDLSETRAGGMRVRRTGASGSIFLLVLGGASAIGSLVFAGIAGWVLVHWQRHKNDVEED
jgi:hypothetical protein